MENYRFTVFPAKSFSVFLVYSVSVLLFWDVGAAATGHGTNTPVHIGLILDSASPFGAMVDVSISMALQDFYTAHPDFQTRLILHRRDAQQELDVASAAIELMKNEEVHSLLGPQMFTQDKFIAELGGKVHVPVISFSGRSQSVSYEQTPYFVRTTPDDSNQARALVSICKGFDWLGAVILYEDSDYGRLFLGKLTNAFQEAQIQIAYMVSVSVSAEDHHIMNELRKLITLQTRVFLVHMNANLGSRLFLLARQAGMISEGYAWFITDSIGNFMNSIDDVVIDSMEGVIGLKPYVPKSKNLDSFRARWTKNMLLMNPDNQKSSASELNAYVLWAYDTVWALAMAVENVGPVNLSFLKANFSNNGSDISNLGISQFGPKLLNELHNVTFDGLSGVFSLVNGQLNASAIEIFNVYATGERPIGYWTPVRGFTRKLSSEGKQTYSNSVQELKSIVWPGVSTNKPKGWSIPQTGKLRVGVPKKDGFTQFVNVSRDPLTKKIQVTGFSIDIFLSVLQQLPFSIDYEFIPFVNQSGLSNGSYNDLLYAIPNKTFDMVVGDATILADRAKYVDFTLPYSETGTVMVVRNRKDRDIWIFVKPFRWDLWLLIFGTCLCIGIVLQILEHSSKNGSDSIGPKKDKLGLSFPIASLAFPERDSITNKWSSFVMVVWLLMAFILMQSYTANLSAMFTVDQLDYRFSNDDYIGVQEGSFVRDFLINHLDIDKSRIREYGTIEDYHDAMTKGSKNGGIDAIFDEIPYMNLFLDQYGSEYKTVGPTYKTDGFGFAFPQGSPLVVHFSRAILAVTEGVNLSAIQQKNFGPAYSPSGDQSNSISSQSPKLTVYDFGGLFIIIGSALLFALFCSETPWGRRLTDKVATINQKSFSFPWVQGNVPRIHSSVHPDDSNRDSSGDIEEVQGSDHTNHEPGQEDLDISARNGHVNAPDQGNHSNEIQLSELGNTDTTERQTG